ncbi:MAG TPA: hypothetical protein VMW10_03050, partial [Alphaproteobacteria bacterium]|nr:hypothetical protein [Alphaproteobacteria bacterium]
IGAKFYEEGKKEEAKEWSRLAVQFDNPSAQCTLGVIASEEGNYEEAERLLIKAAEKGHAMAINNIFVTAKGFALKGDKKKTKEWLQIAAQFDHADAQYYLGQSENEEGNLEEAQKWLLKAAKNGFNEAVDYIKAIGIKLYKEGKKEEAKEWWELADKFNHGGVKK